jgi:hypothetical protein
LSRGESGTRQVDSRQYKTANIAGDFTTLNAFRLFRFLAGLFDFLFSKVYVVVNILEHNELIYNAAYALLCLAIHLEL